MVILEADRAFDKQVIVKKIEVIIMNVIIVIDQLLTPIAIFK